MNISRRTALILSLTSLLGLGGTAAVSGLVLDDAFRDLEEKDAGRDVERVRTAVQGDLAHLAWTAAQMSDLVAVVFGNTTDGASGERLEESADLIASIVRSADVDAIALGADGAWTAWSIRQENLTAGLEGAFLEPPAGLAQAVASSSLAAADPLEPQSTLLGVGGEAYLAGARAVPQPVGNASVAVVALRLVDDGYVAHLAAATGLRVDAHASGFEQDPALHRSGLSEWIASDTLRGDGEPVLQVRVAGDRDVYQQGLVAFLFVVGGTGLLSGLLLTAGLVLMRSTVTGRLRTLAQRVGHVREAGDLSARVALDGDDELSELSQEFDLMLADLQHRSEELTRSNEELGAFASVVSHDLKSPLATFSMNLHLLSKRAEQDGDEKQRERIARMERAVKAMQDRIEAVLEYSRAGREPKRKVVALDDVARTVLEDVEAHLVETGAHVELQPLPSIRGDRQAMAQVFQNLVQNAVKYRRPDVPPRIRIRAEEQDGGWAILVADNGRGFEQEDAQRMLQPFARLQNGLDQAGHGVGLATVVRIMEAHDGSLTAFGRVGRGAIMRLWFPRDRVLAPPSPGRASLVGGLKNALTTKPVAPAVPSAPPVDPDEVAPGQEPQPGPEPEPGPGPAPPPEPGLPGAGPAPEPPAPAPAAPAPPAPPAPALAAPAPPVPAPPRPPPGPEARPGPEATRPPRPHRPPAPAPEPPDDRRTVTVHDDATRPGRRGTHHSLRGASLTDEEREDLEAHLGRSPGPRSQRSSRPARAKRHGPEGGPDAPAADRAR